HFYLTWPLLLLLLGKSRRRVLTVSLLLAAASFLTLHVNFEPTPSPTAAVYYRPDARFVALLIGCALAALPRPLAIPAWVSAGSLLCLVGALALSPEANTRVVYGVFMPIVWVSTAVL